MKKVPEYWLDVPGSEKYQLSNYGNFRRKLKNEKFKIITPYLRKNKWLKIKVDFNGKYKEHEVHKIVAAVFLEKPPKPGMVLYHKNGFVTDNYAGNLDWITRRKLGEKCGGLNSRSIPVIQLDAETGEIINFYKSIGAAARDNFIHKQSICDAIKGRSKTSAGFKWKVEGTEFDGYDAM
ncbi:NUMOD4 domain-containing protein [Anaerosolibacter sp.]|uniref:NUMOD4 domain-containing protein n=1 Tax=Anaerosolibacter sp. TaxID=1872527 RepID=UPI0039F0FA88